MEREDLWRDFNKLPPEAQEQVIGFIAALKAQYSQPRLKSKRRRTRLDEEPFIGMWRDREDMRDSSAWVRKIRSTEMG